MYLEPWKPRRKKNGGWKTVLVIVIAIGIYLVATREGDLISKYNPLAQHLPTPTPTKAPSIYFAEAQAMYEDGNIEGAIKAFEKVVELEKDNEDAYVWLAKLLAIRGHTKEAVKAAREAVKLNPDSARNKAVLAMALDWDGDYEKATELALEAVDTDPNLGIAHAYLA